MSAGGGWADLLRQLGGSLVELIRAEAEALRGDLEATGRGFSKAVALFLAAAAFLFWSVGVLTLAAVEGLAVWLPRWGAALTVGGLLLAVVAILFAVARRRLKSLEAPAATVRRHVADSTAWWTDRVAGDRQLSDGSEEPEG